MAATPYQHGILRLLAAQRKQRGESYVAGGVALNQLLSAPRLSRDIDLFHRSEEAVAATWTADSSLLAGNGYQVNPLRHPSPALLITHFGDATHIQCKPSTGA